MRTKCSPPKPRSSDFRCWRSRAASSTGPCPIATGITICRRSAREINERTKIVYLANPNNPTGTIFSKHEFDEFYRHVPERVLIILDEAYFEYAKDNPRYPDSMHYRYDNVITLRTFSKIYGLAGVRIGYGFAHEDLIANLLKVKLPFEPSTLAQAAGIGALADKEFLHRSLELNARGLQFFTTRIPRIGTYRRAVGSEFRHDGAAERGAGRATYSRVTCARHHCPAADELRIAELRPYLDRDGRRQPALCGGDAEIRGYFIMQELAEKPIAENKPRFPAAERHRLCRVLCGQRQAGRLLLSCCIRDETGLPIADPRPARAIGLRMSSSRTKSGLF